jgi:hypothetical protein
MTIDVDMCAIKSRLNEARYLIGQAQQQLGTAASLAEGSDLEENIEKIMMTLDTIRDELCA